ncbi:MAG: type II secretion system F family protein [Clostridiales bacterium]|nr:type II secretion system F family protein [Clostridiales bacterium]
MAIKILLFITISIFIYFCLNILYEKNVHKKIKQKLLNENEKYIQKMVYRKNKKYINEKYNLRDKIYLLLIKTGITENKLLWWFIPETIILLCIILFFISYILLISILKLKIATLILSGCISFIPIFALLILADVYEEKLEKNLITYIIQLKNQVRTYNDIILAFKNTAKYAGKPLETYIKIFIFEVNNGVNIAQAFDNLKNKINIDRFKQLITNLESCYINGGSFYDLLDKTQNIYMKVYREKVNRNEQTMSARIVLIILIGMSLFVYFNFINSNTENYNIMVNDFIGRIIIYWNFISIWIMVFLIIYVKKVDN